MSPPPRTTETLADWIKAEIMRGGPVTVAQFMEWALYHPEWGYYSRGPQIGPRGDFVTSPEASPVFGAMLARHVSEVDGLLGSPERFDLVECGPGTGALALHVLDTLRSSWTGLYNRLRYTLVETSPALTEQQRTLLEVEHRGRVAWARQVTAFSEPIVGAVIGNEFLDAFPVHILRHDEDQLREVYVQLSSSGGLELGFGKLSCDDLQAFVDTYALALETGDTIEVSLGAAGWLRSLGGWLARGVALFFDYGDTQPRRYSEARRGGTLLGYGGGQVSDDPLAMPGERDLTALVDFTHMSDAAKQGGMDVLGITRQATFLVGLGLGEGNASPLAQGDVPGALKFRKGLQALVSMEGLGRFHVLALSKGLNPELAAKSLSGLRYKDIL
jgi:SAM-dependent MidA family methyltransferase